MNFEDFNTSLSDSKETEQYLIKSEVGINKNQIEFNESISSTTDTNLKNPSNKNICKSLQDNSSLLKFEPKKETSLNISAENSMDQSDSNGDEKSSVKSKIKLMESIVNSTSSNNISSSASKSNKNERSSSSSSSCSSRSPPLSTKDSTRQIRPSQDEQQTNDSKETRKTVKELMSKFEMKQGKILV